MGKWCENKPVECPKTCKGKCLYNGRENKITKLDQAIINVQNKK